MCFVGHTLIIIVFFFSQIAMAESPPDIPESLNPALRDVLLRCFESKLDERPPATELLRHPLFTQMWKEVSYQHFFSLNSVNLNYSSEAVSFINAAHSDISPTCDRVVSLDPELVKIFRKVITLCVTSACLNAERQSWIQEFLIEGFDLWFIFFSYTRAWISEINVSTLEI